MSKHKHKDSPYSLSGSGNVLNQGSFCNLEMEMILYFRKLSFEKKVAALSYMITMSQGDKNMQKHKTEV